MYIYNTLWMVKHFIDKFDVKYYLLLLVRSIHQYSGVFNNSNARMNFQDFVFFSVGNCLDIAI